MWREWHAISLQQDETVDVIATAHDLDVDAVAAINHVASDGVLPAGKQILLPGRGDASVNIDTRHAIAAATAKSAPSLHIVRSGESLWSIARSEHVRIEDLLRWNGLQRTTTLHRGQRLRLAIPESESTASTTLPAGSH
jgi:membrane-bound lytic murein transglycosylase D